VAKDKDSIRVYLEPNIKETFKTACFDRGLNMSDVTAQLVEDWVRRNPPLKQKEEQPQSVAQIVQQNFWTLREHNIKNIDAIAKGAAPTKADIMRISSILNLDQGELLRLAKDEFGKLPPSNPKEKDANGCNSTH
jgi:hypothetical protein